MDFGKLAPWNWFKKEEEQTVKVLPERKEEGLVFPASFYKIESEFNDLYDSFKRAFGEASSSDLLFKNDWFKPSLDVASDEKEYSIKIELPGMDVSNITIECSANTLKVHGEKRQESEEKNKSFYRIERSYGSFERILDLPEDSDADNITSSYKDGVLSIKIPRKTAKKKDTKSIEIDTES